MPNPRFTQQGVVSLNTPQSKPDTSEMDNRIWPDGSFSTVTRIPDFKALAAEGRYYAAMNTPGFIANGITGNIQTTLADTTPTLLIANGNTATGGVQDTRIYLDQVHLHLAQASANNTDFQFAWKTDIATRYTSGGTNISPGAIANVGGNVNQASSNLSKAQIYAGVLTVVGASAGARVVISGQMRPKVAAPVDVIGDAYFMKFGNVDPIPTPNAGTTVGFFTLPCPPIILGPQQSAALYIWGTAMSATAPIWFPIVMWGEF